MPTVGSFPPQTTTTTTMERQSTTFILMKIIRDLNFNTNTEVGLCLSGRALTCRCSLGSRTTTSFCQRTLPTFEHEHRSLDSLFRHRSDRTDHKLLRNLHVDRKFQDSNSECSRASSRMQKPPSTQTARHSQTVAVDLRAECPGEDLPEH